MHRVIVWDCSVLVSIVYTKTYMEMITRLSGDMFRQQLPEQLPSLVNKTCTKVDISDGVVVDVQSY